MPERPKPETKPSRSARPKLGAKSTPSTTRPSGRGGRHLIPDLDGSRRVKPPPRTLPPSGAGRGGGGRPPKGVIFNKPTVGGFFRAAGNILTVAMIVYDSDRYLDGQMSTPEYLKSLGVTGAMILLPHPLSTAIMAHQLGTFLGGYAASKVLEAYNESDPIARALVNWMRRNGWINANDPTFIAVAEAFPPNLTARRWVIPADADTPLITAVWAERAGDGAISLIDAAGQPVGEPFQIPFRPGLNRVIIDGAVTTTLPPGRFRLDSTNSSGARQTGLEIVIAPPETEAASEGEAKEEAAPAAASDPTEDATTDATAPDAPSIIITLELRETRLEPTDLPWERFDRADALIGQDLPPNAEAFGAWRWLDDAAVPGGRAHLQDGDATPVHYALFETGTDVVAGDNIIQYLWIEQAPSPRQIVIQVYDEALSGRHRLNFGGDALAIEGRSGHGLVQAGRIPARGRWLRLRLPVADIGMDGRQIRGVGFWLDGGRVRFGPTRLSGVEDRAPMLVDAAGRDYGGAPQSDLLINAEIAEAGRLTLTLVAENGDRQTLFDGDVTAGPRRFWRQGPANLLPGGVIEAQFLPTDGKATTVAAAVAGNPSLVARILYPPHGAVVRQTVPIFGQAGGGGFARYTVETRPVGAGDDAWALLTEGRSPTVMTLTEVRAKIARILARELRSTVHGNLASLQTGSALHHFEFATEANLARSGWVDIRLRSYDAAGTFSEDTTAVRIGEVATGQVRSEIRSPDGQALLIVPPLSLPAGMGALSIDLDDQSLPPGAPKAVSRVYGLSPGGLELAAPIAIAIADAQGRSIIALDRNGVANPLATERVGALLTANVRDASLSTRFYAADVAPPPAQAAPTPEPAPWFADAPAPGLVAARLNPPSDQPLIQGPIPLDQPLGLLLSFQAADVSQTALIIRYDGGAAAMPLGRSIHGVSRHLVRPGLGLAARADRQAVFLRLDRLLPAGAKRLEAIQLVQISAAAWRTFVSKPTTGAKIVVNSVALGMIKARPAGRDWTAPAAWGASDGAIAFAADGWHWAGPTDQPDATTWPILVDGAAPTVGDVSPSPDSETSDLFVGATLADLSGVDLTTLRLSVNDVPVPATLIGFDRQTGRLQTALGKVPGLRISNGANVTARLEASDLLGNATEPLSWSWRYRANALAFGNLRQLTIDGAGAPAWSLDGASFVFVAEVDGQSDLFRMSADGGERAQLTNDAARESAPTVDGDGRIAYVADNALRLLTPDGTNTVLARDVVDPSWDGAGGILAGKANIIVRISGTGDVETLCAAQQGAKALAPRQAGDRVLFTQAIYHRTIWACAPATGEIRPLSHRPDSPKTRDVDATPAAGDAFIYARGDGADGLWRRDDGGGRDALILPAAGAIDRRPTLSPDGSTLLFESDRTGRREIWRLDLDDDVRLSIADTEQAGAAGAAIRIAFEGAAPPTVWRVVNDDGTVVVDAVSVTETADGLTWTPSADLPEGDLQLEAVLPSGLIARSRLTIDRTPPVITIVRVSDRQPLAEIETVAELDRFMVILNDAIDGKPSLTDGDGAPIAIGQTLDPADFLERQITLKAADRAGNVAQLTANFALVAVDDGRLGDPAPTPLGTTPEPKATPDESTAADAGDDDETAFLAIAVGFALLVLLLGLFVLRRRSR